MLRSLFFFSALFVLTVFFSLAAIIAALLTRGGNVPHLIGRLWSRSILFASGVRVRVEGWENIDPNQPYVFAANHQSQFDIFALLAHLPIQFRWLAKRELFRIPIFGLAMKSAGYISIDRSNRREAFRSIDIAATRVREGTSIVIFPEGTRSLDGKLKSFKKGGFHLAIKSGRPIVPVSLSGTFAILPKKGFRIRPRNVLIHIGQPVPTEDITVADRNWLISEIRRRIQEHLPPEEKGEPEPMVAKPTGVDS
ncbi:MAG: lysophospholipid acyltransferase family protein [Syntrophobacterales bacterium]|jgi:1-acyl-sn-glycerol-3-phosphate acyltransferase